MKAVLQDVAESMARSLSDAANEGEIDAVRSLSDAANAVLQDVAESMSDAANEGESDSDGKVEIEPESSKVEAGPLRKTPAGPGSLLAQRRVQQWLASRRRARRDQKRLQFTEGQRFSGVDIEGFRQATQMRVDQFIKSIKNKEAEPSTSTQDGVEAQLEQKDKSSTSNSCSESIGSRVMRRTLSDPQITLGKRQKQSLRRGDSSKALPSPTNSLPSPAKSLPSPMSNVASPMAGGLKQKGSKQPAPRRRVAIVGGGPVGLWIATLVAQRHYRRVQNPKPGQPAYLRNGDAPEIVVFEKRAASGHCTRRNVRITLDAHTVGLLNKHTKSDVFVSGMALSEIEEVLLGQWKKICGPDAFVYEQDISSPADLFTLGHWDLVLWAAGKKSLPDADREALGCTMKTGEAEEVLVFEMRDFSHPCRMGESKPVSLKDLDQLAAADLMSGIKEPNSCRVVLRCTLDRDPKSGKSGGLLAWLWLMGLPSEIRAAKDCCRPAGAKAEVHGNLLQALNGELQRLGVVQKPDPDTSTETPLPNWVKMLRATVNSLQDRVLSPSSVSVRWVDAAFWSSEHAVCSVPGNPDGQNTPMVVIGDAAVGKPFFTGTTLNIHMAEVKALSQLPIMKWGITSGADVDIGGLIPYEQRYQELIQRCPGFRRKGRRS